MNDTRDRLILIIGGEEEVRRRPAEALRTAGFDVSVAATGAAGIVAALGNTPDLILLGESLPDLLAEGVCAELARNPESARVPVVWLSAKGDSEEKAQAFAAGAVDVLAEPFDAETLIRTVRDHLGIRAGTAEAGLRWPPMESLFEFHDQVLEEAGLSPETSRRIKGLNTSDPFRFASEAGMGHDRAAEHLGALLSLPVLSHIDPERVRRGLLSPRYCRSSHIAFLDGEHAERVLAVSNPFDLELRQRIEPLVECGGASLALAAPRTIEALFDEFESGGEGPTTADSGIVILPSGRDLAGLSPEDLDRSSVIHICNDLIYDAVRQGASDIHLEPKKENLLVRFRIDGVMCDRFTLKKATGIKILARLKAIGKLDIAERRKPQDGSVEAVIGPETYLLRLATTSTPNGESLVVRVLNPNAAPLKLEDLGMAGEQARSMSEFAERTQGLILVVGPTGSGKTTTIYSLLAHVDTKRRSLLSVEDPVEYRIPYANHQQVNDAAGVTFHALLKSAMRQDPDILYLGEIRDGFSAETAFNFASTGHLSISTLHTANTTRAIFRLERLGISRSAMADGLLGICAQRLIRRLCPHCRRAAAPDERQEALLSPFLDEQVAEVGSPVGCPRCGGTGFKGRTGIYEILQFDPEIAECIRRGTPISEIRKLCWERNDLLISRHAAKKVAELEITPEDAQAYILGDEDRFQKASGRIAPPREAHRPHPSRTPKQGRLHVVESEHGAARATILVVEDDPTSRTLMVKILEKAGYRVVAASDGIEALLCLGRERYDLILSDVSMPHLDGFQLQEQLNNKSIDTPVIFATAFGDAQFEMKGLELGAADFITKPIQRDVLLLRIEKALRRAGAKEAAGRLHADEPAPAAKGA